MSGPLISLARFLPEAAVAAGAAARFSTAGGVAAYKLPELPYAYSALEPVISGQIMELHHAKHHASYVANLNKALEEYAEAESKKDLQKMIALLGAINFNGGGECSRTGLKCTNLLRRLLFSFCPLSTYCCIQHAMRQLLLSQASIVKLIPFHGYHVLLVLFNPCLSTPNLRGAQLN